MKKSVIIIRGVSGSGKSTFSNLIADPKVICTADDWYYETYGFYNWNVKDIPKAHGWCKDKFLKALDDDSIENIVIANTNTKTKDFEFYASTARSRGIPVHFIVMENRHGGKNTHNVPEETLIRQKESIIESLKL
jgi:ATP-dependent phosphoenolpyruvate carboxykinase